LVIENDFPNGRPPLEKAGVIFTDKDTVEKVEKMKVCTCLNPLHTVLGIAGCLLEYKTISQTIGDKRLRALIEEVAYNESMPVVTDPGVINPKEFLEEVLNKRFPNPFTKDTPQRIAEDTSFKIPVRFGETLKLRKKAGLSNKELKGIPYFVALWLRYLLAVNDKGNEMPVELDSGAAEIREHLKGLQLGDKGPYNLKPILSNTVVFGIDLYEAEISGKVEEYFAELISAPGTVEGTIQKYFL
jgi:fructuronate reductase